jgi:hypothetical protein
MKTLDEVIDAMERCSKPQFDCTGCPYEDDDAETGCHPDDRDADVLHYLKEFKRISARLEKIALGNITETLEKLDNPALTWDELRQMEGKPVWMEDLNDKGDWVLLSGTEDEYLYFVYRNCAEYKIYRDKQGTVWQAYRKERL